LGVSEGPPTRFRLGRERGIVGLVLERATPVTFPRAVRRRWGAAAACPDRPSGWSESIALNTVSNFPCLEHLVSVARCPFAYPTP